MKMQLLFGLLAMCGIQMFGAHQLRDVSGGDERFVSLTTKAHKAWDGKNQEKTFDAAMELLELKTTSSLCCAAFYFNKLGKPNEIMTCVDALIDLAQKSTVIEHAIMNYGVAGETVKHLENNKEKLELIVNALNDITSTNPGLRFWINNTKSGFNITK